MFSLIFILVVTALGVIISVNLHPESNTWLDYYYGAMGGILLSGIILQIVNKRRRKKELEKDKR